MTNVKVCLESVDDVKNFIKNISNYDYDCDLTADKIVIDAKSFLGVMSLGLSKPVNLVIHSTEAEDVLTSIKPYLVK